MYYIIFYTNGDCEKYEGEFKYYSCCSSSIKMIVEYNDFDEIINCFNPNDI
jgi:hypothetical protein